MKHQARPRSGSNPLFGFNRNEEGHIPDGYGAYSQHTGYNPLPNRERVGIGLYKNPALLLSNAEAKALLLQTDPETALLQRNIEATRLQRQKMLEATAPPSFMKRMVRKG